MLFLLLATNFLRLNTASQPSAARVNCGTCHRLPRKIKRNTDVREPAPFSAIYLDTYYLQRDLIGITSKLTTVNVVMIFFSLRWKYPPPLPFQCLTIWFFSCVPFLFACR